MDQSVNIPKITWTKSLRIPKRCRSCRAVAVLVCIVNVRCIVVVGMSVEQRPFVTVVSCCCSRYGQQ